MSVVHLVDLYCNDIALTVFMIPNPMLTFGIGKPLANQCQGSILANKMYTQLATFLPFFFSFIIPIHSYIIIFFPTPPCARSRILVSCSTSHPNPSTRLDFFHSLANACDAF
jgi:hypothetical protein